MCVAIWIWGKKIEIGYIEKYIGCIYGAVSLLKTELIWSWSRLSSLTFRPGSVFLPLLFLEFISLAPGR